jgi:hypothetical protein
MKTPPRYVFSVHAIIENGVTSDSYAAFIASECGGAPPISRRHEKIVKLSPIPLGSQRDHSVGVGAIFDHCQPGPVE